MEKNYTIEEYIEGRVWRYTFTGVNAKGETLYIELSKCTDDPEWKNSNAKLWKKNGYMDRVLETYWHIDTEIKDTEGSHWRAYDPSIKLSEDGKRNVINFDWMFEATEENKEKLINEVYRLWSEATGETATEKKVRKVKEFAHKNNLEVVTEIPEGWEKTNYVTDPSGCTSICNMKATFKAIHDGTYQRKLLLV